MLIGDPHVVGHPGTGKRNRHIVLEHAFGGNHPVPHVRRGGPVIEEHELAGALIDFGVCRNATLLRPIPVLSPNGFQGERVDLVGLAGEIPHRQRLPL